jgi:hypothetical protein
MPVAYAVVIREKTRKRCQVGRVQENTSAIFQKHPATFLVNRGRYKVTDPLHKIESTGKPEFSFAYASRMEFLCTTGLLRAGAVLRQAQAPRRV